MATVLGLRKGQNGTRHINFKIPTGGTPVNAVASQGTLTVDTQPTADDTMTIGATVYTFTAATPSEAGGIYIGADLAAAKVNIVAAINGTDGINDANATVSAAAFATNDCVLTARTKGVAGDLIVTTETFTAVTNVFDAATLGTTTAGVDGTVGEGGDCYIDDTYLYYCLADNSISDIYWRRIAVGSAY